MYKIPKQERNKQVIADHENMSISQIAKKYNLAVGTVGRIIMRHKEEIENQKKVADDGGEWLLQFDPSIRDRLFDAGIRTEKDLYDLVNSGGDIYGVGSKRLKEINAVLTGKKIKREYRSIYEDSDYKWNISRLVFCEA